MKVRAAGAVDIAPTGPCASSALRLRARELADQAGEPAALDALRALLASLAVHPPGAERDLVSALLHAGLAIALGQRGEVRDALEQGLKADALAERSGDAEARALAALAIGQTFFRAGHLEEARRRLLKVTEIDGAPPALAAHARMNIAATLRAEGRLAEAAVAFEAIVPQRGQLPPELAASLLINAASCDHQLGRTAEAEEALSEARRLLPGLHRPDLEAWTDAIGAWVAARDGRFDDAVTQARRAFDPHRPGGSASIRNSAARALADAAVRSGDPQLRAEAITAVRLVLDEVGTSRAGREPIELRSSLATLFEGQGDLAQAVRHLRVARSLEGTLAEQAEQLRQEQEALRMELLRMQVQAEALRAHQVELERANQALVASDNARARLLATLAHDLRSPLTTAMAMVEIVDPEDPDSVREGLRSLDAAVQRMVGMLDQALAPQGGPHMEAVDLVDICRSASVGFQGLAARKSQQIELLADAPVWIRAHGVSLGRLIDNLLSNALKYGPVGQRVQLRVRASGRRADLEVLDQGPGFPGLDPSEGLFFGHQLSSRTTGGESSWGLGLHVVYQLLAELGGILSIGNRTEGGAIVRVTLPLG